MICHVASAIGVWLRFGLPCGLGSRRRPMQSRKVAKLYIETWLCMGVME